MSDETCSLNSIDRGSVVAKIAHLLRERLTQIEREALVRELGANPEDVKLKPETRDDFAWAMIDYFERRGRMTELCAAVERAVEQRGHRGALGAIVKHTKPERAPAALFASATRLARGRAVLIYIGVLLALGATSAAAALYQPSGTVTALAKTPGVLVSLSALSSAALFPSKTSGTLIALRPRSSPEAAQAHQELCDKLKAVGGTRVRCIHLEDHGADLPAKANELGASLAVAVEQDATAHLMPLGKLAGNELLAGGLRPIDVSRPGVAERLSSVLNQLSIIAAPNFEGRDAVCIPLPADGVDPGAQGVLDEISLLAVYTRQFTPSCIADERECGLLDRVASCNPRAPETALSCELAMYLLAERCPSSPAAVATLNALTGPDIPEVYRDNAMVKLARQYCRKGAPESESASRMLFELASRGEPCMTATLSEVATCLLLAPTGSKRSASQSDELRRLASLPLESFDACGDTSVASRAIAGRAYQRALAGEWRAATADYEAAYQRHHLDDYLLSLAESLLHEGSTSAVTRASELLRYGDATPRSSAAPGESGLYLARISIRRAVLSWIAANKRLLSKEYRDALWEQVVHEYASAREGDLAVSDDQGLKELLDEVQGGSCVFKRLSIRYTGSEEDRVEAMRSCMPD